MTRREPLAALIVAGLVVGCATPTFSAEQRVGFAGMNAGDRHRATGFVTRTAVALGVVPREGTGGSMHVEVSSGYDTVGGAEHIMAVVGGFSAQPVRVERRVGVEALAEVGGPVVGRPAFALLDLGLRTVVSIHLGRRTVDDRNRVYSLLLRNVILTLSLRGVARVDTGLVGDLAGAVTGYLEAGVGLRFQLGTDLQ